MNFLFIVLWLLFAVSGTAAVVLFMITPDWVLVHRPDRRYKKSAISLDVSWCKLFWFFGASLFPSVNVAMNAFWIWYAYQKLWRDRHKGRHLFYPPRVHWPKLPRLPKCGVAFKGRTK